MVLVATFVGSRPASFVPARPSIFGHGPRLFVVSGKWIQMLLPLVSFLGLAVWCPISQSAFVAATATKTCESLFLWNLFCALMDRSAWDRRD